MRYPYRLLALLPILSALWLSTCPPRAAGAEDATDAIEKDLAGILKEMDALSSELERIEEVAVTPRPTSLRVEIRNGGAAAAPAAWKLFLDGKPEIDREWSKGERERFQAGSDALVLHAPLLPGTHEARLELTHPSWKAPATHTLRSTVHAGETLRVRLSLTQPPGKKEPALVPATEK